MEYFAAGVTHRERLMLAANRIGKTEGVGGYEFTLHATGQYPAWWVGRRFDHPIRGWVAGDTGKTVREILQHKLLGPPGAWGTGLIPADSIDRITRATGIPDAVDSVYVKHVSGGISHVVFKSYDQRREAFQGTEQDVIWEDEEPPLDIHTECLLRTMTNNGMIMLTFTPLLGMSEVVLSFLPGGNLDSQVGGSKFVCIATWDDAPHLSKESKEELWSSIPPFQRDARSKGIPQLGAGAIYPVPESDLMVDPFVIPPHFRQGYGMDVGWNCTAALWGAYDPDNGVLYLTGEHKRTASEPVIHAAAIRSHGDWMPGFIDPASRGRGQKDGSQLFEDYLSLGLKLQVADNGVESGLYAVWDKMSTGRIKVFRTLSNWLTEFRLYRRDDKGHVVKSNDHLMDCMRYLESGVSRMTTKPVAPEEVKVYYSPGQMEQSWMA